MYKNKEVPTTASLLKHLEEHGFDVNCKTETFRKFLHSIGFKYKKLNKRCSILQSPRLINLRKEYVMQIRQFRSEGRPIVYLDETWYDSHDVVVKGWIDDSDLCCLETPPSRGKRIIILNAGYEEGWIPGCLLLSARNIANSSADYHSDMNHEIFEKWFQNQLVPNLPEQSVIVMDNAPYHSKQKEKIPTKSSRKNEILEYLRKRNIDVPDKATKKILLALLNEKVLDKSKTYNCDEYAKAQGHTVLRLPPYYCVLNPIELVWSHLKHLIRKSNRTPNLSASVVNLIREKSAKIDNNLWTNCIKHVKVIEDSYVTNTVGEIPDIIINLNDDSDDDDEEE